MANHAHVILQTASMVDIAMLRNTVGANRHLSSEMLLLLALVTCDGYLLFPSAGERLERAAILAARVIPKEEAAC